MKGVGKHILNDEVETFEVQSTRAFCNKHPAITQAQSWASLTRFE